MKINLEELEAFIDENCEESETSEGRASRSLFGRNPLAGLVHNLKGQNAFNPMVRGMSPLKHPGFKHVEKKLKAPSYEDFISRLIFYINERDMTHPQVYKAAGMTPDCFSKIMRGETKTPTKESIVTLALALRLNYEEATDLLSSAGYSFCDVKQDVIYEFCFKTGPYTVDEVNEALVYFHFDAIGGRE